MPSVAIQQYSRLRFSNLVESDGYTYWDLFFPPTISVQTDDIQYTVDSSDRPDLLAYRFYGDPVLWWVIAVANDMDILPTDLKPGAIIRIPSPGTIRQLFVSPEAR